MALESGKRELEFKFGANTQEAEKAIASMRGKILDLTSALKKKQSLDGLETIELQAKAGVIPLTKLRDEIVKTTRAAIAAKGSRAEFINDKAILNNIIRLKELNKELASSEQKALSFGQKMSDVSGKLQGALLPITALTAAFVASGAASFNSFKGFERTLNTIKAVSSATDAELKLIKQSSLDLGAATIFSNREVAESYEELAKAGFTVKESLKAMPDLLSLAAAAGGDLALASGIVSSTLKAFNLEATETGRLADVIAQGANTSAAGIEDLGLAYKQVAPIASQTNQSIEDMTALLALLANNAVKGGDAGSDLRNVITRLLDPSKEAAGVMAKLNISLKDVNGNVKALPTFFKELNASFAGLSDAQKAQAASILAGAENLKTFLILTGQAPSDIDSMVSSMRLATGAAEDMANTINQGSAKAVDEFGGALETAASKIGESLAPAINTLLGLLTDLINAFSQNQGVVAFATGVAGVVTVVLSLTAAVAGATVAINALKVALAGTPIGPFIIGMTALAAAVGLVNVAVNNNATANDIARQSLDQLRIASDDATRSFISEQQAAIGAAEEYDRLAKQTKITEAQKAAMETQLYRLQKAFPLLNQPIDVLIKKYGSLAAAIKEAIISQAAFEKRKDFDNQIKTINDRLSLQGKLTNRLGKVFQKGFAYDPNKEIAAFKKEEQALAKQRTELHKLRSTAYADSKKIYDVITAPIVAPKTVAGGGNSLVGSKGKKAKDTATSIASARKQLNDLVQKLEVEQTGFELGEFKKREAEAKRVYDSQLLQIQELAKKGKVSQAEVTKAQAAALKGYNATLSKIKEDEEKYLNGRREFIAAIATDTQRLNAELTQGNPFDNITAEAKAAEEAITNGLSKAIEELNTKFGTDRTSENYQTAKDSLMRKAELEKELAKKTEEEKRTLAKESLAQLGRDILTLRTEISGDELAIEKQKNKNILADLDFQIAQAKARLEGARNALPPNPTEDQKLGLENLEKDLEVKQAQRLKLVQDGAKAEAAAVVAAQALKVESIQKEIDLYGERQDLLDKQKEALIELIRLLEIEAKVTGQTEAKRLQIGQQIIDATKGIAENSAKTSKFGKTLSALQQINLPNENFNTFFHTTLQGFQDLNKAWDDYFSPEKGNAGKGLGSFLKDNGTAVTKFVGTAGQALSTLGKSVGGTTGKVVGALGGALSGASIGSAFGPVGTAVGAVLGLAAGLFGGGGSDKESKRKQEKFDRFDAELSKILGNTDQNDLNSLDLALTKITKAFRKNGGSRNLAAANQAIGQIQAAIKQRKEVIQEAIRDLTFQNETLNKQLAAFNANELEQLKVDREINLSSLAKETTKALEQFKDSAEVMNLITQNAELRRQAILAGATEEIINAVIQEQNQIRELRAQTAVDNARVAGDAVGIINAELQARLVALDNDIASFKGAEETKTEFLKQKAAERNRILKDANSQVEALLEDGLAILNEGLVTAETKGEGQQKRIQKLFGNLNPMGLIQADGNLVSQSVTVNSGAFQFILEGIQDATSLVDQIKDPAIQSALRAAINQALARA